MNVSEIAEILSLIGNAGLVVKGVLAMLVLLSVACWSIILYKYFSLRQVRRASSQFLEVFWNATGLDQVYDAAKTMRRCPLSEVFKAGYVELVNIKTQSQKRENTLRTDLAKDAGGIDNITRSMRRAATTELSRLESMVSFLATTGSTAPFIGLFGTVWGIMSSFINIGRTKDTSLAVVAPGISEALIATAVGLFAAIPAVVFYNYFLTKIKVQNNEIDNFANDLLNIIKRRFF